LRNKYFPDAEIAVLSNSTTISNPKIKAALLKVDKNILKLDSAFDQTILIHNQPRVKINAADLIDELASFNGKLTIQTLFLRGKFNGQTVGNTTPAEISAWLKAIEKIKPLEVMIYTISRDTPNGADLEKVPLEELRGIAELVEKMGIRTQVSG
jgi:wyosine [tRNA(Phe)-imidazoG37] synthetase (radical SAM superfamily)